MFGQAIPRSFLWLVSICAVLIIGTIGCGGDDDDNEWVGTWSLETVDGQNVSAQFEAFKLLAAAFGETVDISYIDDWIFNGDGTWRREVTLDIETADDRETTSFEVMGTYSLSGSNYTLTVTGGDVQALTAAGVEVENETDFDFEEITAGTWSREGKSLTLNSDDGTTIGFKKK